MSTKSEEFAVTAHEILMQQVKSKGIKYKTISERLQHTSHTTVSQWMNDVLKIPVATAYDLGIATEMTTSEAEDFFLLNLRERNPDTYSIVMQIIKNERAAARKRSRQK